jgi:cytochrome P450
MSQAVVGNQLTELSGAKPFIGHVLELSRDRIGFMNKMVREVDRIARVRSVAGLPAVAVNHPEVLQELLVERARVFEKSMVTRFALYPLAGEGLFTARYEIWRKQRRLMAPLFQPSKLAAFGADMVACTDRALDALRDGAELPLLAETTRITMSIAGKTLFQADTFTEADEIGRALTTALDFASSEGPGPLAIAHLFTSRMLKAASRYWPALESTAEKFTHPVIIPGERGRRVRKAIAFLDETVQGMIDARRQKPGEHADLLARLLEVRDEDDGERMSDKQVRDEVLTLFVAGHETTATALAWSVYLLCKHPEIYAAAVREADALVHAPTVADLPRLTLALRVVKEALRLYPPVYFDARQAQADTTLDGAPMREETVALFSPYALHRRPDFWPDPERFDPERFLPAAEQKRSRYAWLPFGVGPRICIGMGFALMEGQLVLARMLQRFRFELMGEEEPSTSSATLRPKHGVRVRVHTRSRPSA